jgi:hypothetical protein
MSVNINMNKLNQYADRFTTQVLRETYGLKTTIGGPDLLKITPVRQVNLGILNRLFDQWRKSALTFRSAYFDFENDEVKQALGTFMNTVSQHISVKREDLEPLLRQSVKDALLLLYTPETYFEEKLKSLPEAMFDTDASAELVKYTHIHQGIAKELAAQLVQSQAESVSVVRAVNWLSELMKDESVLDEKGFFERQFSEVISLFPEEIVIKEVEPVLAASLKKDEPKSFFDAALSEIDTVRPANSAVPGEIVAGAMLSGGAPKNVSPEMGSLNNRFKVDIPKESDDKAYGSVQVKVESIAGSIPLGQRFMFVNQLFSKNSEHFEKAIYELDSVKSYAEAEDLIWHRYASKHAWDVNGEAVAALLAIVKRKFSN